MKKNLPLLAILFATTFLIVGCGDDKDPRLSDDDIMCIKVQKYGGSCGGTGGTAVTTAQTTQTVTVTQTSTAN